MKTRHRAEQIVAKLRQADVELGKGLTVQEFPHAGSGRGVGENFRRGRRRRKFLPHKELWRFVTAEIDFAKPKN